MSGESAGTFDDEVLGYQEPKAGELFADDNIAICLALASRQRAAEETTNLTKLD